MSIIRRISEPISMLATHFGALGCITAGAGVLPGVGALILPGVGESASVMAGAVIMAGVVSIPVGAVPLAGQDTMVATGDIPTMVGAAITAAGDILPMLFEEQPGILIWLPEMERHLPGQPLPTVGLRLT